ncbi:MAG: hypothetical protein ABI429_06360, partial [Jatrophihabitantaceae bacterium]
RSAQPPPSTRGAPAFRYSAASSTNTTQPHSHLKPRTEFWNPTRPYDLRHAAVSFWLNAGVPAPEVADRAGHGVDVLLRVYASCIDGNEATTNNRIDLAFGMV